MAAAIAHAIEENGGWIGFERFMELALYAPGLGYYARADRQFGWLPESGSDFVTAPELTPLFGRALGRQVIQALQATGVREVWEFGGGSGALAAQLIQALGDARVGSIERYTIVELSAALQQRQRQTIEAACPGWVDSGRVVWASALPARLDAVVVGNEVLDAMPVVLLHFDGRRWYERGVACESGRFVFADRPTELRSPRSHDAVPGTTTEMQRHAEAFVRTLAATLVRGAAFFIDYGFPEAEFHHPQRSGGTLMCHQAHRSDGDPLLQVGCKDITAHVDFTGIALAGQDAGLEVLGYTSQARFLMNCGLLEDLSDAALRDRVAAQKLLAEHEMGELFKVIGFAPAPAFDAIGFAQGDRSHTL